MGLLDYADLARKKLAGLLGEMPLVQMAQGRAEMPTRAGLLGKLKGMPVFSPDAGESAYEAAMQIGPMGLGKIVYHGSPHKFDKFDASKIGTGEGAQAYGHGVYLADAEKVAQGYRRAGETAAPIQYQGEGIMNWALGNRDMAKALPAGTQKALAYARDFSSIEEARRMAAASDMDDVVSEIDRLAKAGALKNGPEGNLYKSDLPDEWIPKMLDWDKPLKEQPEILSKFSDEVLDNLGVTRSGMDAYAGKPLAGGDLVRFVENQKGKGALANYGIPGIRYLDGGSRGKGQGSYNYVVFPGLEDQVKILERNGIPLSGLLGGQ